MLKDDDFLSIDFRKSSRQSRFSFSKVKNQMKNQDISNWANLIQPPQKGLYAYPSSLQKAIIHQQSCYLRPDDRFLNENFEIKECDCCGQKIRRRFEKYMTSDLYESLVPEFGITIPLYFSFLKLHIFLLSLISIVFGGYFSYYSYLICKEYEQEFDQECQYTNSYFFLPQNDFIFEFKNVDRNLMIYYSLSFAVFIIIMMTPFIHEIFMRAMQIRYWQYDPWNHIRFNKLSVYVKHLPKKMTESEIQQSIYEALSKSENSKRKASELFDSEQKSILELLYIYDIHPISILNKQRQQQFLQLLIISSQIKQQKQDSTNLESKEIKQLKENFQAAVIELMIQTKEIQLYMNDGLPYTNKMILTLKTEEQANAVYMHFQKSYFRKIQSQMKVLWQSRQQHKDQEARNVFKQLLDSSALSEFSINSDNENQQNDKKSPSDLDQFQRSSKRASPTIKTSVSKTPLKTQGMTQNTQVIDKDLIESTAKARLEVERNKEVQDEKKDIQISRGFREDDIFWENIGMHTLKRFNLRIITFITVISASILCMGVFEYLFTSQNSPKKVKSSELDDLIYANFMTLLIVFLSVLSSIIILTTTLKSRRSTYTLQEMNIINFMSFTQLVFVLSFPYFMVLTVWQGLGEALPIYNLVLLGRTRIVFKGITHIFHLRSCGFWCRRRKIVKQFNGNLYFQKQLNNLMTPGSFPIRARLLYAFFVFSTGYLMIFLAPYLIIICLIFQVCLYYFDRYTLYRVYTMDKLFTFQLMQYLVSSYQIIMTPIYTFIYVLIFRNREFTEFDKTPEIMVKNPQYMDIKDNYMGIAGLSIGAFSWMMIIFFKSQITDFWVFKILRFKKPIRDQDRIFEEKTYFESYQKYFLCINNPLIYKPQEQRNLMTLQQVYSSRYKLRLYDFDTNTYDIHKIKNYLLQFMENLRLPHAKLFYFVGEMFKRGLISDTEKCMLKEYVITEKLECFLYLEAYENTGLDKEFQDQLISMVRMQDLALLYGSRFV